MLILQKLFEGIQLRNRELYWTLQEKLQTIFRTNEDIQFSITILNTVEKLLPANYKQE